nr:MAG TPA: hypothetical protein [Caudoviricetes sp.]
MVQCFRTMIQSRFSKIVQSCNSLVLLGLQDFESWFVEVRFSIKLACFLVSSLLLILLLLLLVFLYIIGFISRKFEMFILRAFDFY